MKKDKFDNQMILIKQKAKITLMMAESVDSQTSPTIHNLWKSAGELSAMTTALKSEVAGNDAPKVGG